MYLTSCLLTTDWRRSSALETLSASALYKRIVDWLIDWLIDKSSWLCRFSPCVFIYLLAVVPAIWLLHLDYLSCAASKADESSDRRRCTGFTGTNSTVCVSHRSVLILCVNSTDVTLVLFTRELWDQDLILFLVFSSNLILCDLASCVSQNRSVNKFASPPSLLLVK